jgi:hypothetical protein
MAKSSVHSLDVHVCVFSTRKCATHTGEVRMNPLVKCRGKCSYCLWRCTNCVSVIRTKCVPNDWVNIDLGFFPSIVFSHKSTSRRSGKVSRHSVPLLGSKSSHLLWIGPIQSKVGILCSFIKDRITVTFEKKATVTNDTFHFLLTDQCTIQNITKLVFSITTLKFEI